MAGSLCRAAAAVVVREAKRRGGAELLVGPAALPSSKTERPLLAGGMLESL